MDMRLLALLFLSLCHHGQSEDEVVENGSVPMVPLIPLMPSHNITDLENFTIPLTQAPDVPDENVTSSATNGVQSEASSEEEEDSDGVCQVSSLETKRVLGSGIMRLGLQLLKNLKAGPDQPNVIISPLSVSLALSQLALGAMNETKELLLQHLQADALPCYHKSLSHVLRQLRKSTLQIATRIYLRSGFVPKQEFLQESQKMYRSEAATLGDIQHVNQWVEKATNSQITDFLSSLPPNLVLLLINAVHFKGEWLTRFDPRFTSSEQFYIDDKQVVNVDMMLGPKYPLSVLTHNELEAQVARLPFKGHKSLLVIMPISGQVNVSAIGDKLNVSDLYNRFPRARSMQVKMPKFKMEFGEELQEVLTKIGLGELFSGPNLAGIAEGPLLVSSVQHKSSMEINEEGAEVAATTSVSISRSNPSFTVNQPFFFALMDDSTQTPLFLGVITNPNPGAAASANSSGIQDKLDKFDKQYVTFPPK